MAAGLGGYSSIGAAVSKMWREEGIRGFYKGLYPNLLKVRTPKNPLSPLSPNSFVCSAFVRGGANSGRLLRVWRQVGLPLNSSETSSSNSNFPPTSHFDLAWRSGSHLFCILLSFFGRETLLGGGHLLKL